MPDVFGIPDRTGDPEFFDTDTQVGDRIESADGTVVDTADDQQRLDEHFQPVPDPAQAAPEPEAAPEPPPEPAQAAPETPAEEQQQELILGKYRDQEALEKGYSELRDLQRRTAERARVSEQRYAANEERVAQLEAALQQAVPAVQQAFAERQAWQRWAQEQGLEGPTGSAQAQPGATPTQFEVDQYIEQRLAEERQSWETQRERDLLQQQGVAAVQTFYRAHPDVEPDSEAEREVAAVIGQLNEAWAYTGMGLDMTDPEALEVAYEASKDDDLRKVLELNPEYVDSDAGMQLARFQAALLRGEALTQGTASVPATAGEAVSGRKPVVERASSGATPSGETGQPLDEFDEALNYGRKNARGGLSGSVFG